ncbi:MAG: YbaN family protein [Planctomycetes bacterium]|nr:YbaN family protein [Planctomycetota bacterium]
MTRPIYLGLAGVFFVLAIVGVFLPVLPATPFVLLTSACLVRSSPKLHGKLRASKLFGPTLRDWEEHRAVRREIKWVAAVTMLVAVGATLAFADHSVPVRIATVVLAAIGLFVILRLKTIESVRGVAPSRAAQSTREPRGPGDAPRSPGA